MWFAAMVLAATAAVPVASSAQADEKKENETPVTMDKIPPAARDALQREAAGAPIIDVVQETEKGQTVYEAHVRKGTDVVGIEVDPSGKVLKTETESKGGAAPHK
jgi:uncharacterized membrane protein YkoI